MPNIKSAQKKVRKDKKRRMSNVSYKGKIDEIVRLAQTKTLEAKGITLSSAYASIDKAAKLGVISKNRAARLKSKISTIK